MLAVVLVAHLGLSASFEMDSIGVDTDLSFLEGPERVEAERAQARVRTVHAQKEIAKMKARQDDQIQEHEKQELEERQKSRIEEERRKRREMANSKEGKEKSNIFTKGKEGKKFDPPLEKLTDQEKINQNAALQQRKNAKEEKGPEPVASTIPAIEETIEKARAEQKTQKMAYSDGKEDTVQFPVEDATRTKNPVYLAEHPILKDFQGGQLSKEIVLNLASGTQRLTESKTGRKHDALTSSMQWFASKASFFPFNPSRPDGKKPDMTLQGYKLLHPKQAEPSEENKKKNVGNQRPRPAIIFSCGWAETVLKYTETLKKVYENGFDVYAIDLRGQGFSDSTGWEDGRVTHVESFSEYSDDMIDFVTAYVRPEVDSRSSNPKSTKATERRPLIYMGSSMGGLIGYKSQESYAERQAKNKEKAADKLLFNKLIMAAPTVRLLNRPWWETYFFTVLHYVVPSSWFKRIAVRVDPEFNKENHTIDSKSFSFWYHFTRVAPRQLLAAGPSVGFYKEIVNAGQTLLSKKSTAMDNTDLLLLQADVDTIIDNDSVADFFEFVSEIDTTTTVDDKGKLIEVKEGELHPNAPKFVEYSSKQTIESNEKNPDRKEVAVNAKYLVTSNKLKTTGAERKMMVFTDTRHDIFFSDSATLAAIVSQVINFLDSSDVAGRSREQMSSSKSAEKSAEFNSADWEVVKEFKDDSAHQKKQKNQVKNQQKKPKINVNSKSEL